MAEVFVRKAQYDYDTLRPIFFEIMDSVGGNRIKENSRVVIKPNLLSPAPPETALVTHPLIIKAAVEYVIEKGANPVISDSPAVGAFEKILKQSGIIDTLEGLSVEYREFRDSLLVDVSKPFKKINIAKEAVNADFMINLPKLKTHSQMLLTLGVKNLFGCIVGMKKPEWHLRAGTNREVFATLLVRIYQAVKPSITIIDGILAMEGEGPAKRGIPRELGVILGSSDAVALDIAVCRMLGIAPADLFTNKIIFDQGIADENIEIIGDLPEIRDFKLPEIAPLSFGPKRFHGFIRKHLVQRPVCDNNVCKLCGECWRYCPAVAIAHSKKKIRFDYDKCIRCYCCIEVCPDGALRSYETITGKVARKLLKM